MKWAEIFKIYNLKQIKKEKIIVLFTFISILIATTISLIIPITNLENERYINNNIVEINGGDLSIELLQEKTIGFENKLNELKSRGLNINEITLRNVYYKKSSNNILGAIVVGEYSLQEDEIILQSALARRLNAKIGDWVELDTQGSGKFKYKVKEIEGFSSGVTRDADLIGYGKVQNNNNLKSLEGGKLIHIKGDDGEKLKRELLKESNVNTYNTVEDKGREVKDELLIQKSSLGVLSTVAYIFSILSIVSTTIMLILKRKKDIATLKILFIDSKEIKKAMGSEICLWVLTAIVLSAFISYPLAKIVLNYSGIANVIFTKEIMKLILKGVFFNLMVFGVIITISLFILSSINPMSIIREEEYELKKANKKTVIFITMLMPILFIAYSIYFDNIGNMISSLLIMIIVIILFLLVLIILRILFVRRPKNTILLYSLRNIKKNFFSFVIVLLSLTFTLWLILIGFNLEASIKSSFKSSLEGILPYNYYVQGKNNEELEKVLKNHNDVEGYIKSFSIDGAIKNQNSRENAFKSLVISEINKEDYGINYKIIEGENLFTGEEGFIIADKLREVNRYNIGDVLEIETKRGVLSGKIKGIYESGGINTLSILKENVELGDEIGYLIKAKDNKFIDELSDTYVVGIGELGEGIAANIANFLRVFRILSVFCIFGTILFTINMTYMNSLKGEKDEKILRELGINKGFIIKSEIIKILILSVFSWGISLGIYSGAIKLFFKAMVNGTSEISSSIVICTGILSMLITIGSFMISLRRKIRKRE